MIKFHIRISLFHSSFYTFQISLLLFSISLPYSDGYFHSGRNSSSIWCDFPSLCIGPWIFYGKGFLVFFLTFILSIYFLFICYKHFISWLRLRVVRAVAILRGLLQIFLFMCLCGIIVSGSLVKQNPLMISFSSCDISHDIPWIRHFTLFTTITNTKALA